MEKDTNLISYEEYKKYKDIINFTTDSNIINIHKELIGKKVSGSYFSIDDCGSEIIKDFLLYDRYHGLKYDYDDHYAGIFLKSDYLSDYFKSSIKEYLSGRNISERVENALDSETSFNEMSSRDIKAINTYISASKGNGKKDNIAPFFLFYITKLDGEGPKTFVKNDLDKNYIASDILNRSGMSDRASYYSGRGVNTGDLNNEHLSSIFKKIYKLDKKYSLEFIKLLDKIQILTATRFINNFYNFVNNGFSTKDLEIETGDYSLDNVYDKARDMVALVSAYSFIEECKKDKAEQEYEKNKKISTSNDIKKEFISNVGSYLRKILPREIYDALLDRYWTYDYYSRKHGFHD